MFEYKGYIAKIDVDENCEFIYGEVINIRDVITFQGRTLTELKKAFKESVEVYLAFCKKQGRDAEKPFSGNFPVRTTPEKHRKISYAAKEMGISLNKFFDNIIDDGIQKYLGERYAIPDNIKSTFSTKNLLKKRRATETQHRKKSPKKQNEKKRAL